MFIVSSRISYFTEYVSRNINKPMPTAESIAQEIHVSRSTLFRMVEKELGMSPFQYIRQEKLKIAKEIFEAGECDSIREIAYAVGYMRADYFANLFYDTFGIDLKTHF